MTYDADEIRTNAMATARAIKAVRIFVDIGVMIGHPPTEKDIQSMTPAGKDAAVRAAGVKVASEGTWKVTEAIARAFEYSGARHQAQGVPVDPEPTDTRGAWVAGAMALDPVCQIPDCGCTGSAHA